MKTKKSFPRIFTRVCVLDQEIPLIRHQERFSRLFQEDFLDLRAKNAKFMSAWSISSEEKSSHMCEMCVLLENQQNLHDFLDAENLQHSSGEKTKQFGKYVLAKILATLDDDDFFPSSSSSLPHTCMRFLGCTFCQNFECVCVHFVYVYVSAAKNGRGCSK